MVSFILLALAIVGGAWFFDVLDEEVARSHDTASRFPAAIELDPHSDKARAAAVALFAALDASESFTLSNGLQVIVIPVASSTEITHSIWYRVGAADDPPGWSGLAHLTEHATFGGTTMLPEPKFSQTLRRAGNKQDAITTYDYTVYYQLVRPGKLETVMGLEADRMNNVVFNERLMEIERKAVLEERRNEVEANLEALLEQQVRPILFPKHPYGNPVVGWPMEFEGISTKQVHDFYRQWYSPNNAVLVLHGKMDTVLANSLAQKYYGRTPSQPLPVRRIPSQLTPSAGGAAVVGRDKTPGSAVWRRDYLAPSYQAGVTQHAHALQLLAEILGGGTEGRLYQVVVIREQLASAITVHYDPDNIDYSTLSISATLKPGIHPDRVGEAIDLELRRLADTLVPGSSITHAKQDLKAKVALQVESMPAVARLVGEALVRGRTLGDLVSWPSRIDAVTDTELQVAARAVFFASRSVTGIASISTAR